MKCSLLMKLKNEGGFKHGFGLPSGLDTETLREIYYFGTQIGSSDVAKTCAEKLEELEQCRKDSSYTQGTDTK